MMIGTCNHKARPGYGARLLRYIFRVIIRASSVGLV